MDTSVFLWTLFFSIMPISELRGALPFAYFNDTPIVISYLVSVIGNILIVPIVYIFLSTVHGLFYRHWNFYQRLFDRVVIRTRRKLGEKVEKYGWIGIMLFVAVPLPVTGAWTGTLGAWLLGIDRKRTFLAVSLGVMISGLIVSAILLAGVGVGSIFIKTV